MKRENIDKACELSVEIDLLRKNIKALLSIEKPDTVEIIGKRAGVFPNMARLYDPEMVRRVVNITVDVLREKIEKLEQELLEL